ncbi:bifunctional ADP-dependent NAD(P)H-hydrate dehydratase/NAD(P)H-hydrate epimerase [Vibrio cholerae]|nr:bifunctional ADP-dependent NAD(P)H-hydrate dehydratase/NAD(P)H-hydrate epimerase [Vibrio cholerae]
MDTIMPLPTHFYTTQQLKQGEQDAASERGLELFHLMERAGQAVFTIAFAQYPTSHHWLICCGGGNNGGDGYIVAVLARHMGIDVTVWQLGDPEKLPADAHRAYQQWKELGGAVYAPQSEVPESTDVIIDALFGIGLKEALRPQVVPLIELLNQSGKPIVAVDVPSGLCADTGQVMGTCIKAQHTVSLIGLKQGLVTGQARCYVGTLHYAGLGVEEVFAQHNTPSLVSIDGKLRHSLLPPRQACTHKGQNGKALIVGGNEGMGGALILCASACARSGAGLSAAMTHPDNVTAMLTITPEVMSTSWNKQHLFEERIEWCDALALGPGLGRDAQAQQIMQRLSSLKVPKVWDADALYFLAHDPSYDAQRIITPHPVEAARLLGCEVEEVEQDRFAAIRLLQQRYGGVVVLKGAGTLVDDGKEIAVCLQGNPGMASGGMGDVLTGIIVALLAQKIPLADAAKLGVWLHSSAADLNTKSHGQRGLLASDLLPHLRELLN